MKAIIFPQDPAEGDLLRQTLIYRGLTAESHVDMDSVLEKWSKHAGDLIILPVDDSTAPLSKVQRLREMSQLPILVIIDQPTEIDLCALLDAGADMVLARPVSSRVLAAYAQVLLRRVDSVPHSTLNAFNLDQFSLDPATRAVTVAEKEPQRLTRLEFRLLYVLVANREQVIPTDTLIERVWGYESRGDAELLRGLVSRVRRKVEPDPQIHRYIENIPGIGYRFTLEKGAAK